MKTLAMFSTVLFSVAAFASGATPHEIPGDVKFQAMNLAVFFGILLYFGAPKIKALFKQRNEDFHRVARETAKAKKELDDKKADVLRLTKQLRETSAQSLAQAKLEAEKVMNEQVAKANEEATRLSSDAQSQLKSDYSKLMEKLRQEALELSLVAAENKLQTLAAPEKAKVNSSFPARVEGATV